MATFEERTREAIRKMTEDALGAVRKGGVDQQAKIEEYTTQLLASLSLDLPLSVKEVLDNGGAVRSFTLPYDVSSGPFRVHRLRPDFETSNGHSENRVFDFSETLSASRFRVTVIIEPLHEEKKR